MILQSRDACKTSVGSWGELLTASSLLLFQPEKFAAVFEALEKGGVKWSSRGPPNKR